MAVRCFTFCLTLTLAALASLQPDAARADHRPAIVVPGRADVPVFIDGVEASGAVVTGEWGLHRAGHVAAVIYPDPYYRVFLRRDGYYPSDGRRPRYGRQEIDTGATRPARDSSYYRAWSASSDRLPAGMRQNSGPPSIIVAPEFERGFSK